MDLLLAFGQAVKKRRKGLRMTQEQLAERAQLHVNFVSLVERGASAPALDSVQAIAIALSTRASTLIRAAERMTFTSNEGADPPR
jgi:transcriptional regulator with XRE-family HTH domain